MVGGNEVVAMHEITTGGKLYSSVANRRELLHRLSLSLLHQ
jgi:hypothetical protein